MAQAFENVARSKALRDQTAHDPGAGLVVEGGNGSALEPSFQRAIEVRVLIDVAEDLIHGGIGDGLRNPELADLLENAHAPSMPYGALPSRHGQRDAPIVERAVLAKPSHGVINVLGVVFPPRQPLAELPLRQLATGQKLQRGLKRISYLPNLVISG